MSLFPAYAETAANGEPPETVETTNWLQNPSFQIDVTGNKPDVTQDSIKKRKKKKNEKHDHKKLKPTPTTSLVEPDDFSIDRRRNKEFLTVQTISRPSVPRYNTKYRMRSYRRFEKKKFKRYYQRRKIEDDKSDTEAAPVITKQNLNTLEGSKKDENFTGFKQEEELSQTTAMFNKKLTEDPHDIKKWLEYVDFQNTVYQFEKTYRKGSIAKGLRVLAERKLSILDKALSHNPNCEELLRERLNVAVSIYPSDELQVQLKNLVDKEQGNIILWQGYIEATQCSMSHCNTPAVIQLYTNCLSILHKVRRNSGLEKPQLEENILKMLYQCALFLKQAGLSEQLWTLLRLYLELNLSPNDKGKFNITSGFQERELVELEEVVLSSQLPLHELWLRTEKLRESCHFIPFTEENECEDPQRIVFPEDVAELIHPITMPENTFRLIVTILTLLKVPLLPCRHSTMKGLGLDYVPWALDSIEPLLPIFFPLYPVDLTNKNLVFDNRMCMGPQYLNVLPGQEEYLDFVLTIMKNCFDCLKEDDKIATTLWWLRFQKLLVVLDKQNRFKMPQNYSKKIKNNIKKLLKEEENRNNVIFYVEYALIEFELGNTSSSLNIIKTALSLGSNTMILATNTDQKQTNRCYLYRSLLEVYLSFKNDLETNKELGLKHLIAYVLEKNEPIEKITDDIITQCKLKLKHITLQLMQKDMGKIPVVNHFLPNFFTDWIICHGWFLFLTQGPIDTSKFIEGILSEIDEKYPGMMWEKEILFEFHIAILYKYCISNPGSGIFKILDKVMGVAIENYPNNLFVLSVLAKEQSITSSYGCPWWKLKSHLIKTGRAFPTLFLVLIGNQQIMEVQNTLLETFTGACVLIIDQIHEVSSFHM